METSPPRQKSSASAGERCIERSTKSTPPSRKRTPRAQPVNHKMPGSAEFVQRAVHTLEAGALAVWVRRSLLALVVIALAIYYLYDFRGLATSQAMDQAQIGRAIASGRGWQTNFVRPRAIGQLQANGKSVARKIWSDTYNAPLPPLVDAIALWPIRHWQMSPSDLVYSGD